MLDFKHNKNKITEANFHVMSFTLQIYYPANALTIHNLDIL